MRSEEDTLAEELAEPIRQSSCRRFREVWISQHFLDRYRERLYDDPTRDDDQLCEVIRRQLREGELWGATTPIGKHILVMADGDSFVFCLGRRNTEMPWVLRTLLTFEQALVNVQMFDSRAGR